MNCLSLDFCLKWFCYIIITWPTLVGAQTLLDIKKDFGATGDGKTDDTKAFIKAAEKINLLKQNVILSITRGNYLLKPQKRVDGREPLYAPVEILYFKNCANIKIKGQDGAKISFPPNLYYGAFASRRGKLEKLQTITIDYRYRVAVGHGISLENCSDFTISNVEIDGNNRSFITGGQFGDVGYQVDNDGIFIRDSRNITLSFLNLHHFGRDGIGIINQTPAKFRTPSQNIIIRDCRFEYNGRQGFSWMGGVGVTFTNCSFKYTGNSSFSSPPGAGVDFEPNDGYIIYDGKFFNCSFENNAGVSVIADQGGFTARKMYFKDCNIIGNTAPALWIRSPEFVFEACTIKGIFYFGCSATKPEEGTKFLSCKFSDAVGDKKPPAKYLIESNGARYMLFDECSFRSTLSSLLYVDSGMESDNMRTEFRNCLFLGKFAKNSLPLKNGMLTNGAIFTGKSVFQTEGERIAWNLSNTNFGKIENQASETIIGEGYTSATFAHVEIGKNAKAPATVIINNGGALFMNSGSKLIIGSMGKLVIKSGGTLWIAPSANLVINGQVIVEQGAYFCINQSASIDQASLKKITIHKPINTSDNPGLNAGLSGCIKF